MASRAFTDMHIRYDGLATLHEVPYTGARTTNLVWRRNLELIARVKRTAGAASLSLLILAGVMVATPGHSYAATPVAVGGTALVTNTDGDSIRVRAGAGTTYDRVASVHEGDVLSIVDGPVQDSTGINWFKVTTP